MGARGRGRAKMRDKPGRMEGLPNARRFAMLMQYFPFMLSRFSIIMRTTHSFLAFIAAACLAAVFFAGCESADGYSIEVSPSTASLNEQSPSVQLTASGWQDFSWTLSDTTVGRLSSHNGQTVVYTATQFGTESSAVTQTILVRAIGTAIESGSSTNSTSSASTDSGYSAKVSITQ